MNESPTIYMDINIACYVKIVGKFLCKPPEVDPENS